MDMVRRKLMLVTTGTKRVNLSIDREKASLPVEVRGSKTPLL